MFTSTQVLIQYLSLDRICDCGHITVGPVSQQVTLYSVVYTKPHIPAALVEHKDLITVKHN